MAQIQSSTEIVVPPAADPQATGIELPTLVDANVRRRHTERVDHLPHLVREEQPQDPQRLENIQEIVCHIIWIHAIGLKALEDGYYGFPQVISRVDTQYKELLTKEELSFADEIENLYEPRMKDQIMEYVTSLTLDQTIAFIKHHRPSQFYSEILRVRLIKLDALTRVIAAADRTLDLEIPEWYSWCGSKSKYLGQLSVDLEDNRHQLIFLLKLLRTVVESIQRATKSSHLTSQQLNALKVQIEAFESYYPIAYSRVYGSAPFEQHLINSKAEKWWETENPKSHESKTTTEVAETYLSSESMRSTLNFIVPIMSCLSAIPAFLAWRHSTAEPGMPTDSDFYQTIAGSTLQLLSLITFIFPILNRPPSSLLTWLWIWILTGFSALCALVGIPLYVFMSPIWSFLIAFAGAVAQMLIQLQIVNSI